jgi:micrococcal nuclease
LYQVTKVVDGDTIEVSRKRIGLYYGASLLVLFILIGITAPATSTMIKNEVPKTQTQNGGQNQVSDKNTKIQEKVLSELYQVTKVVDGDTIEVSIDGKTEKLRLIGIDTPETVDPRKPVQCFGKEAATYTTSLLDHKSVYLVFEPDQGTRDKYHRLLAYTYRDDGLFINKTLIESGYAHEYTYNLPYIYQKEFKAAQTYARENQKGLWAPDTCNGDTSKSLPK